MSVLEQLLDFNSRKELFLKDMQRIKTKGKTKNVYGDSREASPVLESWLGGQLFNHYVLLWSDGLILTCFQECNKRHLQTQGRWWTHRLILYEGFECELDGGLLTTHRFKSSVQKQALQKNKHSKANGNTEGLGPSGNPESPKARRLRIIDPTFKPDWEKRVQFDTRWQLITVTCSGHRKWSVSGEVTPQQRSWHDLPLRSGPRRCRPAPTPPCKLRRPAPNTHVQWGTATPTTCMQHLCVPG